MWNGNINNEVRLARFQLLPTKRKKEGRQRKEGRKEERKKARKKERGRVKYCVWNVTVRERQ